MISIDLQEIIKQRLREAAAREFGLTFERLATEVPPRTELGDLAFPIGFELAKLFKEKTGEKRPPRQLAETLVAALGEIEGVARMEIAGPGYLNVFFDRARQLALLTEAINAPQEKKQSGATNKIIVEHTNINPNKAAHIGHLRNAVLGDSFVQILREQGSHVEVQNYIDNTGVQVADVVVGFLHVENLTLAEVQAIDRDLPPNHTFDYYCWDLYARVGLYYRHDNPDAPEDPQLLLLRSQTLRAIEEGDNSTAELAEYVATRIVECHLKTMERLGIRYDVLPRESEILHLRFWDRAFERLKHSGAIRFESEGRNAGCWVMPTNLHTGTEEHEADKIIVRSNGTVTYAGKDIAYQLWKLGHLGLDFYYRLFRTYSDGQQVWMTTATQPETNDQELHFGGGEKVYNVIDSRQSYTQDVVRRGVAATAPEVGEEASVHLSYEMVALSPAACEEMGIELSAQDRQRSFIEMSGRKGLGVKADDLINRLIAEAHREVKTRHAELSETEQLETASAIAIGALRYFLLKWTRNTIIAFDFKEALSFEGETGPYCQYAAVRANSIFRKLQTEELQAARAYIAEHSEDVTRVLQGESGDELWTLLMLAGKLEEAIAQAATAAEPAILAKYLFQLARGFNLFYHHHRILAEEDTAKRSVLIVIADLTRFYLTKGLSILGIPVPERM